MWPFKRRSEVSVVGNPEPDLDVHAARYRMQRIQEIAEATSKSLEGAAELADCWLIHTVQHSSGDEPPRTGFIASPIWDDEWLLARNTFPTWTEAVAHVRAKGGELLVS